MNATELTAIARRLAATPDRKLGTTRLIAAALLLRQALEETLDSYWDATLPAMRHVSGRAQLISLPFYAASRLAGDVNYAWCRLSAVCHHDAYDVPPARTELNHLAAIIDDLIAATSDHPVPSPSSLL